MKITIETTNKNTGVYIERIFNYALNATNFENFYNLLTINLDSSMKVGKGGSHIWISDKSTHNRLAIITDTFNMMK